MTTQITTLLSDYFSDELPTLKEKYNWRIAKIDGFGNNGNSDYSANVNLKKYLNSKWKMSSHSEKIELAEVIVSDWGGIKNNKTDTLIGYVEEIGSDLPSTPFKGISSYSKIFSIADLQEYAIYDARVAVSLNAIQYSAGIDRGLAFSYPPGRNNITGHIGKGVGFSQQEKFKVKNLKNKGWERIKRDDIYKRYLNLLKMCLQNFPGKELYDLEMILFANAEKEAIKAMNKSN